jgi:hypothetical protein
MVSLLYYNKCHPWQITLLDRSTSLDIRKQRTVMSTLKNDITLNLQVGSLYVLKGITFLIASISWSKTWLNCPSLTPSLDATVIKSQEVGPKKNSCATNNAN